MKFHQNISTRCRVIQVLVFWEYVYKEKQAILGLNVDNSATIRDFSMKPYIQRVLYYGMKWWKNHGIFLTIMSSMPPFLRRYHFQTSYLKV